MTRPGLIGSFLAAALAVSAGCAGEDPLGPAPSHPAVRITDHVFVIDASSSGIGLHDIGDGWLSLDYAGGPLPAPGDIIVGEARGGYIRRARTVERTDGRVAVSTTPAFLTGAVVTGSFETTLSGGFSAIAEGASGAVPAADGLRLDGVVLAGGEAGPEGISLVIEEGRIEFDPEVAVRLTIFGGRVTKLDVGVSGPLELDLDLSARIGAPASHAGRTGVAVTSRALTARIGPVPVPLTVVTRIYIDSVIESSSPGDCAWRYSASHGIDAGMRLDGGWRGSPDFSGTRHESPAIERADGADCTVRIAVTCETEVSLFAAEREPARFLVEARPSADLEVVQEFWPWWSWTLAGGMAIACEGAAGPLDPSAPAPSRISRGDTVLAGSGPFRTGSYIFFDEWDGGSDPLTLPRGLALGHDGRLYVSDQGDHRIVVLGPDGAVTGSWGGYGSTAGSFVFPAGVAVDADGNVLVSDSGNHRVQKFTPEGVYLAAWGAEGIGPGQFVQPEGIAAGSDTLLAVCDAGTGEVIVLGASGGEISRWDNDLSRGVAFDAASDIFVAGCPASAVTKYSLSGEVLDRWETDDGGAPRFDCPIDVAVDPSGTVLVLEYGACRFAVLSPDGTTLSTLGGCGTGPGFFDRPGGIAVSDAGWVYVADTYNGRVQVFAPRPLRALSRPGRR